MAWPPAMRMARSVARMGDVVGEELGRDNAGHVALLIPQPRRLQQHQTRRLQLHVHFADLALDAGQGGDGPAQRGRDALQREADGGRARGQRDAEIGGSSQQREPGVGPVAGSAFTEARQQMVGRDEGRRAGKRRRCHWRAD